MSFDTDVVKAGRGRALFFDFSLDDFATVTYRLSDREGKLDGTNWYTPRVVSCSPMMRGLGQDRIAASGGFELVIANHDGAYDALCQRTAMNNTAKIRVRAYVVIYDASDPTTGSARQLGEYVLDRWPRRNNDVIKLQFADDILGPLAEGVPLPTMLDWSGVGTTATNPLKNGAWFNSRYNVYSPVQLCFGEDWVQAFDLFVPKNPHANYAGKVIVPICCTTDTTTAASDSEISQVGVAFPDATKKLDNGQFIEVPRTAPSGAAIWNVERSPSITKDGKAFKVIYLVVSVAGFFEWFWPKRGAPYADGSGTPEIRLEPGLNLWSLTDALVFDSSANYLKFGTTLAYVTGWFIKGAPLSARTSSGPQQHACDVMKDLVTHYAKGTFACDETSRSSAKAARPNARVAGVVQPWTEDKDEGRNPNGVKVVTMREVLTAICQSSDFDIFSNWYGDIGFATDAFVFSVAEQVLGTTEVVELDEARLWDVEEWIPSRGERGSPFNRLYAEGARLSPPDGILALPFQGPWDFDESLNCGVAQASRIIPASVQVGWMPIYQQGQAPHSFRVLEVQARPRIRFRTFIDGLRLDLGQLFYLTWSRNLGGDYSSRTLFQVESLAYSPDDDTVEVEAAWRNGFASERGYLLDDATLIVRTYATFGRTVTVTDSSITATFASGDLVADGVEAGDILVLQDATQADDAFSRNRALLVTGVKNATELEVSSSDLNFDAASPTAVSEWIIYRGATTYHTAVSDPTNYPSGGMMYGKMAHSSEYSDLSAANLLLDG